jgi:hypothetical protein
MKQENQIQVPTFDELISNELKKYDPILPKVEELKKEFLPLKIANLEDKEGYDAVKDALKFMVTKRHEIEDKRKELKADSLKFGRAVDERAKEIQSMIAPIEEHLKAEKDNIDLQIKAIKDAELVAAQEKLRERQRTLFSIGFSLIANEYIYFSKINTQNQHILNTLNVEVWEDAQFNDWVENFKNTILKQELAAIKEKEEKEAREKQELAEQQAKLAQEQKELQEQKAQMEKEMQEMRATMEQYNKKKQEQEEAISLAKQKHEEELAEKERLSNLSDKDKLQEFVDSITYGRIPELKTKKYKDSLKEVLDRLTIIKSININ